VIKNLRRRGKHFATTPASFDVAGDIEASSSLYDDGTNGGDQGSASINSDASTAGTHSPLDFENAVYSAGALDDDFDLFLHDPLTPQTLPPSTIDPGNFTDADGSSSRIASESHRITIATTPNMRLQHCNNAATSSTQKYITESRDYGFASSLALENFPQMESGITDDVAREAQHEMVWEPQNDSLPDGWAHPAIDSFSGDTARGQTTALSSNSAQAVSEARRVSLLLEDMQPETANRVTSMLLNSNVDVKMKMTVR